MGKRGRRHIALQVRTFPLSIHLSTSPPLSALHIPPSFSPAKLGCHVAVEGTGRAEAGLSLPSTFLCPLLRPSPFSSPPPFTSNSSLLPHEQVAKRCGGACWQGRMWAEGGEAGCVGMNVIPLLSSLTPLPLKSSSHACELGAMQRRVLAGMKEVGQAMTSRRTKCVVLAPNVEEMFHQVEALESSPYDLQMGQYAATALAALDDVAACHWLPC
ncbi:unnamed protein product, partial [Closterium sp. NIES-54]